MRRRLATFAAVSVFALALSAAPALAAGSPLTHASFPATDMNAEGGLCGYDFQSGEFSVVGRDPSTAAHVTAHNVVAERDGASYRVVGSEIYNDLKGHLTWKMMFVAKGGGIADSINVVLRYDRNGDLLVAKENDSCHYYG
jgi:hypothetical protein